MRLDFKKIMQLRDHWESMNQLGNEMTIKCTTCDGSGLKGVAGTGEFAMWSGEFCDKCEGKGSVDWISYVTRGYV